MTQQKHFRTLDIPTLQRFSIGFDQLFDELSRTASVTTSNYPPYNIIKQNDLEYSFEIAVAGFTDGEIDVELAHNELTIRGVKAHEPGQNTEYLHRGIATRDFTRTFALAENVVIRDAVVANGILRIDAEIVIPEELKPKKISLKFDK